jgi:hypothetical protein
MSAVQMACSTCGYVLSAVTPKSLKDSYLVHRDHAHKDEDLTWIDVSRLRAS